MTEKAKKVAVLYGGTSAEREVSLNSGRAVTGGLERAGYDVTALDTRDYDIHQLPKDGYDCAFIALHGRGGEDGVIQGALEQLNIPYTGSGVLGSALAMDKGRSKQIFQALGLPTAEYRIVNRTGYQVGQAAGMLAELGTPVITKPVKEGSSIGMVKVHDAAELEKALELAFQYDEQVLIEEWIEGEEYTVAVLNDRCLPAIRMVTPNTFYDYQAKYQSTTTQYFCPCGLDEATEQELQGIALRAFDALACHGWGRVDVMRHKDGRFLLLEVNTSPGMTETSLVPKAAKVAGLSFEQLVTEILEVTR